MFVLCLFLFTVWSFPLCSCNLWMFVLCPLLKCSNSSLKFTVWSWQVPPMPTRGHSLARAARSMPVLHAALRLLVNWRLRPFKPPASSEFPFSARLTSTEDLSKLTSNTSSFHGLRPFFGCSRKNWASDMRQKPGPQAGPQLPWWNQYGLIQTLQFQIRKK